MANKMLIFTCSALIVLTPHFSSLAQTPKKTSPLAPTSTPAEPKKGDATGTGAAVGPEI
jgi:hypothetical protein